MTGTVFLVDFPVGFLAVSVAVCYRFTFGTAIREVDNASLEQPAQDGMAEFGIL